MSQTVKQIDCSCAYDAVTYSVAIVDVPILSLVSVEIGDPQPSTTTTIGFLTRDPIGYEGSEWDLYEYCNTRPFDDLDPMGLQSSVIRIDILIGSGASAQEIATILGISVAAATALINAQKAAEAAKEAADRFRDAVDSLVENFQKNAKGKTPCAAAESALRQAEKAIASLEKVVSDHQGYIDNPSSYPGVIRDIASARAAWGRDIARAKDNIDKAKAALEILKAAAKTACWCWYNPGRW